MVRNWVCCEGQFVRLSRLTFISPGRLVSVTFSRLAAAGISVIPISVRNLSGDSSPSIPESPYWTGMKTLGCRAEMTSCKVSVGRTFSPLMGAMRIWVWRSRSN